MADRIAYLHERIAEIEHDLRGANNHILRDRITIDTFTQRIAELVPRTDARETQIVDLGSEPVGFKEAVRWATNPTIRDIADKMPKPESESD